MSHSQNNGASKHETKYGSIRVDDWEELRNSSEWEDLKNESTKALFKPDSSPNVPVKCLETVSSYWTRLVFGWFGKLLIVGNQKPQLDPSDMSILPLPHQLTTAVSYSVFENIWDEEKSRAINEEKKRNFFTLFRSHEPSLVFTLFRAHGLDFLTAGLLKLVHDALIFVGPQVLNSMILYLKSDSLDLGYGLSLTLIVTVAQLGMSFCLRHYFFRCYITGLQFRTAVVVAVYKKALYLAASQRQTQSVGEITNLISIDAQRLQDLTSYLHAIWYSFVQIVLALYFLWQQLGVSCLGGVAVIIIMMPVTKIVAGWQGRIQEKLMDLKDVRVDSNNEVLQSMKVIKLQAWEKSFQEKIEHLRGIEMKQLLHFMLFNAFQVMLWTSVPLLVAVATFAAYIISGNDLDVSSALTALALFDILRFPLFMLPMVINRIVEANISLKRVRSFLLSDEHVPITPGKISGTGVEIKDASFLYESKKYLSADFTELSKSHKELFDSQWEVQVLKSQLADAELRIKELLKKNNGYDSIASEKNENISNDNHDFVTETFESPNLLSLRRVNFECKKGEFVAVVGPVGSGKTTFINSVLGEINSLTGSVNVKGNLAYFAQNPFIMNETVKGNIVFGHKDEPFDKTRYNRAINTCALKHDLKILPNGDMCEIGEKGITLSGGQKARVSMARTVYHDADIYLLDDPLAAVDAHVGRHIFQKCIVEELLLKGNDASCDRTEKSTVILVTNALQYLNHPLVDKILVLKDGRIHEEGSYNYLASDPNSLFSSYLSSFQDSLTENTVDTSIVEAENKIHPLLQIANSISRLSTASLSALGDVTDAPDVAKVIAPQAKLTRRTSQASATSVSSAEAKEMQKESMRALPSNTAGELMTDEFAERSTGNVSLGVYLVWTRAAGGAWLGFVIIIAYLGVESVNVFSKWWLTYWGAHANSENQIQFLIIYAVINMVAVIASLLRVILVMFCGLRASKELFSRMLDAILRAPMSFFDTTPIGRIINRFSKDIYTVDEQLIATMRSYLMTLSSVIGVIVTISSVQPMFIIFLIPISAFYISQQNYFNKTYRELKRLDSVARSPIYALLGETLDGVASIRAFNAQEHLMRRILTMLDQQQNAYYLTFAAQCWLAVRLELVGTSIITFTCLIAVIEHMRIGGDESYAGLAGLAISFSLSVTQALNWSVRMASDMEANMIAVERIEQYCQVPSEAARTSDLDKSGDLAYNWPQTGKIEFRNAQLRYRKGLPLVLKGLDLTIPASSKVGVVGRTGAGKSTLMVALMRIVELYEGKILIDDVDIETVGLTRIRSKIAVIPQDPVLFSGTVRINLDPFNVYEDYRLYDVLSRVGLYSKSSNDDDRGELSKKEDTAQSSSSPTPIRSIEDRVLEGGQNFSAGQRQLLVIARALLSEANIVIMDEATAAVDADTDSKIQKLIRVDFAQATCITIAHRLNTVMDSDYILVMDDGIAAEFDHPTNLLANGGLFKDLVDAWEEEHE